MDLVVHAENKCIHTDSVERYICFLNYIIDYLNNGDFVWNKELEEELNKYKIIKNRYHTLSFF